MGIILLNREGRVFWARRLGMNAWQFPQGGIDEGEDPQAAMYRELKEETGLSPEHVEVLMSTDDWLRYYLPGQFIRRQSKPVCIGQKQIWYLLSLLAHSEEINLAATGTPEFDLWKWVDYWHPLDAVVSFKRNVYKQALTHFACSVRGNPVHSCSPAAGAD